MPSREAVVRAADVAKERAGLRVTNHVLDVAAALIDRRCRELGVAETDYLTRLVASSPTDGELERLIREITIGETYFFRGPVLDAVRRHALPQIVARRAREPLPQLRILSAGCATGEEAYSLAIAVRETLPDADAWTVSVTGVDVNTTFLRRAAAACYGEWALREVSEPVREKWFRRDGRDFHLRDEVRNMVRFHYVNLASDPLPAPPIGLVGLDLIVCQNVALYFEEDVRRTVADKLVACLAPEGFLLFGPSDRVPPELGDCRVRGLGEVTAFQRRARPVLANVSWRPSGSAVRASERPLGAPVDPTPIPPPPIVPAEALGESPSPDPLPAWEDAVALADAGDLETAALAFEALIAGQPGVARLHLHHGFVLVDLGALSAAVDAFRRALYLDPSLVIAHAATALVARRLGMHALAQRHRRRVRSLARGHHDDAEVEGWDGMTAGRLLRLFEEDDRVLGGPGSDER